MEPQRQSVTEQLKAEATAPKTTRSDFWNPTLNIRFRGGHCMAFLYIHLVWMNFELDKGILLHFSSHTVNLEGRNLTKLYEELLELRLRNIEVVEKAHDKGDPNETVVLRATVNQVTAESTKSSKRSTKDDSASGNRGPAA